MGRITSFSKQVIVFFLVTALIIRPTFAANVGGWTLGGGVAQGASTVYEGTKKVVIDGADYIKKGTAKITPTAANVAKTLGKGVAGVALSVAVEQLLGAVDWVLDPANNQIKYTDVKEGTGSYFIIDGKNYYTSDLSSACTQYANSIGDYFDSTLGAAHCVLRTGGMYGPIYYVSAGVVVGEPVEEQKTLPLDVVSQQVITNAETGDTNAQAATTAAAADIVAEAEKDYAKARPIAQQLESSAQTKPADEAAAEKANEATGEAKPNTANPEATDLSIEFPVFCGWAPTVCEFAQTATQSIADVKAEYADKPQENTDTELEIPDLEEQSIDSDISFGGSCPAPLSSDINFMGLNKTIEFSFDPVCQIAEFIKPVVISISALNAALIVAGIRTEDD